MDLSKMWLILTATVWMCIFLVLQLEIGEAMLTQSETDLCRTLNCTCVNTTVRKTIHCSGHFYGTLPRLISVPLDASEIDLSECGIPYIKQDTFEGIYMSTTLTKLDFSNNDISIIDDYSFEMFINLRKLILRRNRLTNFTLGMFHGLRQLEELDLSYNNVKFVDMDVLLNCISLRSLYLRYSGVTLQGLQDLLMSTTSMLETLDAHGLDLQRLPRDIFLETSYIKTLILSGNQLEEVPSLALSRLKFISVLDLSDNLIVELNAADFDNMESLEELYLNTLSHLMYIHDGAFHSLKHLKVLSCSFNPKLQSIHPGAFKGITTVPYPHANYTGHHHQSTWNLQEVLLRQNALPTLAEELLPWEKIRYIDLAENPWNCDCRLRWMKTVKWNLQISLQCALPRTLRNRPIDNIPVHSLICEDAMDSHLAASIALLLSTLVVVSAGCCIFACWKLNWFNRCRAMFQRRYRRLKTPLTTIDYSGDTSMTTINDGDAELPSDDTK
ncbi:hypothetical protein CHUAL_003254 [Chamberlinius hualienensis]